MCFGQNISVVSEIHKVSETIQNIFQKYKYFDEFLEKNSALWPKGKPKSLKFSDFCSDQNISENEI